MADQNQSPAHLAYERCVAALKLAQHDDLNTVVIPNTSIVGAISGKKRQIDVLIDGRFASDSKSRIIVDAKLHSRPVDIKEVESFLGMMKDCRADRGVLVCSSGCTDGAKKRAHDSAVVEVFTPQELDDWKLSYEPCLGNCSRRSGGRGMVLWGKFDAVEAGGGWVVLQIGVCDGCHDFHVWCWDCGQKYHVPRELGACCHCGYEFSCDEPQEEDDLEDDTASIWLWMSDGQSDIPLDSRPTR